jgi:hypothetical protein
MDAIGGAIGSNTGTETGTETGGRGGVRTRSLGVRGVESSGEHP